MNDSKILNPVSILGFYFLVFQSYPGKFIKCWMDGDENYSIYYPDEFVEMCRKANVPNSIISKLIDCFSETSMFMWDVEHNYVRRLSVSYEPSNIGEEINKIKQVESKPLSETTQIGWGSFLDTSEGGISLKI